MEISKTQRFLSSTNVNYCEPRFSDTSPYIHIQFRIEKTTRCRKKNDKQKIHDDVVSSDFHNEVLEASEDDDIFSYHAKIYDIMTKRKTNASAIISELCIGFFVCLFVV